MSLILDQSLESKCCRFVAHFVNCHEIINCESVSNAPVLRYDEMLNVKGLAQTCRMIIKYAVKEKNESQSLLGFKQNCLKACAAVSPWTRFCENILPSSTEDFISQLEQKNYPIILPGSLIQLEKELDVDKKTANAERYFRGKNKDRFIDQDIVNSAKEVLSMEEFCCLLNLNTCGMNIERVVVENNIQCVYLCGFNFTLADMLVFVFIMEMLIKMSCCSMINHFFSLLPSVKRWFLQCVSHPVLLRCMVKVWGKVDDKFHEHFSKYFLLPDNTADVPHISFVERKGNPKQFHIKMMRTLPDIYTCLQSSGITVPVNNTVMERIPVEWERFPTDVDPAAGELNERRSLGKRQQISNMLQFVLPSLKKGGRLVEFCAGGGHLGITAAYLRPDCSVLLIENKEESIERAQKRIKRLNLLNVDLQLSNIEYFEGTFDVGTSLHACGSATDLVLNKCIQNRAVFVISPCCYGSIVSTCGVVYPRSAAFDCLTKYQYNHLAHSADQTSNNYGSDYSKQGKKGMLLVDYDRCLHAQEYNCDTKIYTMHPESCSPKNNLLVGQPCQ